jgi:DNA invertase Pin-like site-specific DNA recombinase
MAATEAAKFAQLAAGLIPREALLTVAQKLPGGLDGEDWELMLSVCAAIKQALPEANSRPTMASAAPKAGTSAQRSGRAKDEGKQLGRPRIDADFEKRILAALMAGETIRGAADKFNVNPSTVQRIKRPFDVSVAV